MSTSFQTLIQACAKQLATGQDQWPVVSRATVAGAAAGATLVDGRLADSRSGAEATKFVNKWVRIPLQTVPYWEAECVRLIGTYAPTTGTLTPVEPFAFGYDGTGVVTDATSLTDTRRTWTTNAHIGNVFSCGGKTLTVTGNTATKATGAAWVAAGAPGDGLYYSITKAVPSSTVYEVHWLLYPSDLKDCINLALSEMTYQEILPLGLVTDGDMETSGTASWATLSNATVAKNTSFVQFGTQSLAVTATAANGYVQSVSLPVTPGEQLIVPALVYGDQKQAELVLYNVTGSADIETARHDEEGWGLLYFTATVPADCYEVALRLRTKTNAGVTYWDFATILKASQSIYDAPSWLVREQDFLRIVSFPTGSALSSDNADNAYQWWGGGPDHQHVLETVPTPHGVVPLRLALSRPPSQALFVSGKRYYATLSADADTTAADEKTVEAGALYHAYQKLGPDYSKHMLQWAEEFGKRRRAVEGRPKVRFASTYG